MKRPDRPKFTHAEREREACIRALEPRIFSMIRQLATSSQALADELRSIRTSRMSTHAKEDLLAKVFLNPFMQWVDLLIQPSLSEKCRQKKRKRRTGAGVR